MLGFAHVGVLAALHDRGLRPDAYAGTSAGAVVAALSAHQRNGTAASNDTRTSRSGDLG